MRVKSTRRKPRQRSPKTYSHFFLFLVHFLFFTLVCEPVFALQTEDNTLMSHQRQGMLLLPKTTLTGWVNPKLPVLFYPYKFNILEFLESAFTIYYWERPVFSYSHCVSFWMCYLYQLLSGLFEQRVSIVKTVKGRSVGWKQQREHNAMAQSWTLVYNIPT